MYVYSIPPLKRELSRFRRFIYGLLPMAKLAETLMGVRDTGKLPNREVAKSPIVFLVLILVLDESFALV